MPAFPNAVLPKPKDWNEFEEICLSAAKSRWGNPNFTRFGRQGQQQNGVDICGYDIYGRLIGVQCKNTLGTLTEKIVEDEISNAESFTPTLLELNIATSASSDVNLQRHVMELSKQRVASGKFGVAILFWSDIEQDLSKNRNELARFYPQFFNNSASSTAPTDSLRDRDINRVQELLEYIDVESTGYYLEMAPKYVAMKFIEHEEPIQRVISSPVFMLYDKELEEKLYSWLQKWFEMTGQIRFAPYNYMDHRDELSFIMPMDFFRTPEENQIYERLQVMRQEFLSLQNAFCHFIHEKYPEIDLKKTSLKARRFHSDI
ncbi:hypothetical protein [Alishewanella tabrizica]|uniref:Restriction endonuclease type IV Mrr domain-containing protein n=1 Tax=Alishewanella tabrizica TaxID=671278 RepID=A0ABQ2WV56_9ALTE|nr:hypothetical protein [Alishewanella tabrizica]GGW73883.1 hypothetical protein GCM10008111_32160 [Alishewanella tabrizica]